MERERETYAEITVEKKLVVRIGGYCLGKRFSDKEIEKVLSTIEYILDCNKQHFDKSVNVHITNKETGKA